VPGATRDGVSVTIDDARRVLSIEVNTESDESSDDVDRFGRVIHRQESFAGTAFRNVILPENAKLDAISSAVDAGQLCVTVPKINPSSAPRAIAVAGGAAPGAATRAAAPPAPPAAAGGPVGAARS